MYLLKHALLSSCEYLSNIHLCCVPWGLALMFIQTFRHTVLIFTYIDYVPPFNSGGRTDGKSQMNNLMKS